MMTRLIKILASLKFAVFTILAIAGMSAWGTFVEADLDASAAQKLVYHSPLMYVILAILSMNLIAVMVDRWPWKEKHTGFLLAHVGILILLAGSLVTRYVGLDGSISMGIGEVGKNIVSTETDLTLYSSLDGTAYTKVDDREVDFFLRPPTPEKPFEVNIPVGTLKIIGYIPYAFRDAKIVEDPEKQGGASVRFQLQNANVNMTEWLSQKAPGNDAIRDLGPAQVVLAGVNNPFSPAGRNTVLLRPKGDEISYEIHTARDPKNVRRGVAKAGDTIETGWMGLVLRLLKYVPSSKEEVKYKASARPTPLTVPAIEFDYNGKRDFLAMNAFVKLFSADAVYILSYANRRIPLAKYASGLELKLLDFKVGRYQGTTRAASYESRVLVPEMGEVTISMNEPLYHKGLTFYQSSFDSDESGRPTLSVLSVNQDPGRWVKYLGSLLIVLGSIHLFYFKRKVARQAAAKAAAEPSTSRGVG